MSANELLELTTLLKVVLWIEVIVYMGIGIFEILDSFSKEKPWNMRDGRVNSYLVMREIVSYKMHAAVCFLLGFIALNGLLEGSITRFELELIFLSLALIMMLLWMVALPGRLGFIVIFLTKPETSLQIVMFIFFADLIRPWVMYLCIFFNIWGFIVYFVQTRKKSIYPYDYSTIRQDALDAGLEVSKVEAMDKAAGYSK
jgi:magnesium-transporting ATPase (P-type)